MEQTEIDICIISYAKTKELEEVTKKGIETLIASEPDGNIKFNILVLESNRSVSYDYPNVKMVRTYMPFSYHRYLNIARKEGNAPYVFLANNDLVYEKYWATEILKVIQSNPSILSASPWCPQTNDPSLKSIDFHIGYQVRKHLAGWAIFCDRKIFDVIGDLDERYKYWYSDNDYSMTLQKHGITHALVTKSVVNHHEHNHGATGQEILSQDSVKMEEYTNGQSEVFCKKWNIR